MDIPGELIYMLMLLSPLGPREFMVKIKNYYMAYNIKTVETIAT